MNLGEAPAAACGLADEMLSCGCQAGPGRRGGWELGCGLLAAGAGACVHGASHFTGGDSARQGWRPWETGLGGERLWAALGLRTQSGDPRQPRSRPQLPFTPALVSLPACCEACELFTTAQLSLVGG